MIDGRVASSARSPEQRLQTHHSARPHTHSSTCSRRFTSRDGRCPTCEPGGSVHNWAIHHHPCIRSQCRRPKFNKIGSRTYPATSSLTISLTGYHLSAGPNSSCPEKRAEKRLVTTAMASRNVTLYVSFVICRGVRFTLVSQTFSAYWFNSCP